MTLQTRRIIYVGMILFFLILAPAVILYSLGYSYDWQKKTLVKTGAFYFESMPNGAQIFINDKNYGKTDKFTKRLLPKDYKVSIIKDGFFSWEKQLKIESQIVTEARNILLIPKNHNSKIVRENLPPNFDLIGYSVKTSEKQKMEQASTTAASILKTNSFASAGNSIFYLNQADNLLYESNLNGSSVSQISLQPLPGSRSSSLPGEPNGIYKLSAQNSSRLAALNQNKDLYLFNPKTNLFDKIDSNVNGAEFSLDHKKIMYWTDSEIWVIYLEKIQIQPYKKAGEKELITRFAEKITSAIWYTEDNEHIIFVVGDTIKIIELDGRDRRNVANFIKMENFSPSAWNNPQLYYNLDKHLLYFINNNKLYSAQIKSSQSLIQATGLFN
jgi:hypothetical protein